MENFRMEELLKTSVTGQKRTGKTKQFTFLTQPDVIKGPYKNKSGKWEDTISRSNLMVEWNIPLIVPVSGHFGPDTKGNDTEGSNGYWLKFKNVLKGDISSYQTEENCESWEKGYTYQVISDPKYPLMTLNKYLDAKESSEWVKEKWEDIIFVYCVLFCFKSGDGHFRNILVDKDQKLLYVIDYEETRGSDEERFDFYFTRPVAQKYHWKEQVQSLYPNVIKRLEEFKKNFRSDFSDEFKERLKTCLNWLNKFTGEPKVAGTKTGSGTGLEIKGVWSGAKFSSYGASGHKVDTLISALQKYIRRGNFEKAIRSAFDVYNLKSLGGDPAVSNLFNRLEVIAVEDVSPGEYFQICEILKLLVKKPRDPETLYSIVKVLCSLKKSRIMSHLWFAYDSRRNGIDGNQSQCDEDLNEEDEIYLEENLNDKFLFGEKPEQYEELARVLILMMIKRIQEKSRMAYKYARLFFINYEEKYDPEHPKKPLRPKGPRRSVYLTDNGVKKTTYCSVIFWKALEFCSNNETRVTREDLDTFIRIYYERSSDRRAFIQMILMIHISDWSKFESQKKSETKFETKFQTKFDLNEEERKEIEELLEGNYKLELDAFVIDKHTSEGRKRGMGTKEFVKEGSKVTNQDPEFFDQELMDLYENRG